MGKYDIGNSEKNIILISDTKNSEELAFKKMKNGYWENICGPIMGIKIYILPI